MNPRILHRLALFTAAGFASSSPAQQPALLEETVVVGKRSDLLGIVPAASKGSASGEELRARPLLRRGEALEAVPGMVVTQHAGGGKANQYFLRGFNLDHGTDFAISIDRMPVNMRTHSHGQGYADLNILMPEVVERVDYHKGTYTARDGDLSSAGSADFRLIDAFAKGFATAARTSGSSMRSRRASPRSSLANTATTGVRSVTHFGLARATMLHASRSPLNTTTTTDRGSCRKTSTAGTVSRAISRAMRTTIFRSR